MRRFALLLMVLSAGPAQAQDRAPAERQALVDLAYVLGESHALRQACQGEADQFWRARMIRLVELEAPDESLDRRLRNAFNTGFSAAHAAHGQCTAESRAAAARAAAHGQELSKRLSQSTLQPVLEDDSPDTIAAGSPPR